VPVEGSGGAEVANSGGAFVVNSANRSWTVASTVAFTSGVSSGEGTEVGVEPHATKKNTTRTTPMAVCRVILQGSLANCTMEGFLFALLMPDFTMEASRNDPHPQECGGPVYKRLGRMTANISDPGTLMGPILSPN
jgi:hypothetical protein